jgi:3-oxoacyl-[acyl-carrier protein] reductase
VELKGKVCLVTGGTSGIGAATARKLAAKGAHLVIAARGRALQKTQDVELIVQSQGSSLKFLEIDVADAAACRSCIDQTIAAFGRIDVLVHSAGGPAPGGLYAI